MRSFQRPTTLDRAVPGVSDNTIRLALTALKNAGHITSEGTGRGAAWRHG